MEALRWVLLVVGIVFILAIYIIGRNKRRNGAAVDEFDDDLPSFSARNLDDVDEGVGEVRIVTDADRDDIYPETDQLTEDLYSDTTTDDVVSSHAQADDTGSVATGSKTTATEEQKTSAAAPEMPSDIIVLYILPKPDQQLLGSHINSSAQAMGLSFGDMNIFHYRPGHRNIFSLANMLEPGSFDPDTIHDMRTTGLTVFMQITGTDPMDDLTEMLQRSYQLAGLLDARLCNSKREPLTEQDAENYRTRIREMFG